MFEVTSLVSCEVEIDSFVRNLIRLECLSETREDIDEQTDMVSIKYLIDLSN